MVFWTVGMVIWLVARVFLGGYCVVARLVMVFWVVGRVFWMLLGLFWCSGWLLGYSGWLLCGC